MVSRKDQLNAYTFARKRTVAAFLQPTPARSEEGAPRPLRTIVPSVVVAALILVGFGAWGILKPTTPKNWKEPGKYLMVGSESTTRYVVLGKGKKRQLHPVLNLASARLVLKPENFEIVKVKESQLDQGGIPHGATIGIPYAPDRLPRADDAKRAKTWSVCLRTTGSGADAVSRQSVAVLAGDDQDKVRKGKGALTGSQVLYVQDPDGARYLIDASGTRFLIGGGKWKSRPAYMDLLLRALFDQGVQPQPVTAAWLKTFNQGAPLLFPVVDGMGDPAGVDGLEPAVDRVGMVLRAPAGGTVQHYVVLDGRVAPVSDLVAQLLLMTQGANEMYPGQRTEAVEVPAQSLKPDRESFYARYGWPEDLPKPVNDTADPDARNVACSVYHGRTSAGGTHRLSVWAGTRSPFPVVPGGTNTYVTPGSGLLFRRVDGTSATGATFLLTDTGLRYGIRNNRDSAAAKGKDHETKDEQTKDQQDGEAKVRLGYGGIQPVPVPAAWADFLNKGPTLDTAAASQPQS